MRAESIKLAWNLKLRKRTEEQFSVRVRSTIVSSHKFRPSVMSRREVPALVYSEARQNESQAPYSELYVVRRFTEKRYGKRDREPPRRFFF